MLSCVLNPLVPAYYIEKALRKKHDVIKFSPLDISEKRLKYEWNINYNDIKDKLLPPEIGSSVFSHAEAVKKLPWNPDVLFYIDTHIWYPFVGIEKIDAFKVCWLIDAHTSQELYLEIAKKFDIVFLTETCYVEAFRKQGIKNVFWMPLACDDINIGKPKEKTFDISFIGSIKDDRKKYMDLLNHNFNFATKSAFYETATALYEQSRLVLHISPHIDSGYKILSARIFEAMASGSALITDRIGSTDINTLLKEGRDYIGYTDSNDLVEIAKYYLNNENEREEIAKNGFNKVTALHTYDKRIDAITDIITGFLGSRENHNDMNSNVTQPLTLQQLIDREDFNAAISICLESIKSDPDNYIAYNTLGDVYSKMHEYEKAIRSYKKSLSIKDDAGTYNNIANIYFVCNNFDSATKYYNIALSCDKNNYAIYQNLGILSHLKEEYENAMMFYNESLKLNPKNGQIYNNIFNIFVKFYTKGTLISDSNSPEITNRLYYLLSPEFRFEDIKIYLKKSFEYL